MGEEEPLKKMGVKKRNCKKYPRIQSISATCSTLKEPILGVYEIENCFANYTSTYLNGIRGEL